MKKNLTWTVASAVLLTLLPAMSPSASPAAGPESGRETGPKAVRSKPVTPVDIDGVPCAAGYVFRFEATGRLSQCTLDRDAVVRNADLRKGTTVALNPDGSIRYVFLPGTTMVGEHSCRGQGHGWMTHFSPERRAEALLAVARRGHPGRPVLTRHVPRRVLRPEVCHHGVPPERRTGQLSRIDQHRSRRAALRGR